MSMREKVVQKLSQNGCINIISRHMLLSHQIKVNNCSTLAVVKGVALVFLYTGPLKLNQIQLSPCSSRVSHTWSCSVPSHPLAIYILHTLSLSYSLPKANSIQSHN